MIYRNLGKTGIQVSVVGMGCEGFEKADKKTTAQMIDTAMSLGINFIEIYSSNPVLRENIGSAFSKYPREGFVVQGHIGSTWHDGQYVRSRDVAECKKAFEDFLRLMKIEYADLGCLHYCDEVTDFEEIFGGGVIEYAKELKKCGKIRAISISTHNPVIARKAAETGLVDVVLFSINPAYDMVPATEDVDAYFDKSTFDRSYCGIDPERADLYRLCQNTGVAIIVMKGFAGGLLLSETESPFGHALTPLQCLHYCLTRPAVASVMVGAHSAKEFAEAAKYADASEKELDYSDVLAHAPKSSFDGHCMYCGHCAPCTNKIDIAAVNKYLDLALSQGFVPETVQGHYDLLENHAADCIECGNCMKNCPFGVDIIEKMRKAKLTFGK